MFSLLLKELTFIFYWLIELCSSELQLTKALDTSDTEAPFLD